MCQGFSLFLAKGYKNRYNLINCGHEKITFMCFKKGTKLNVKPIKQQLQLWFTRHLQQFKITESFRELIKYLASAVPKSETIAAFKKITGATYKIIPVSIALSQSSSQKNTTCKIVCWALALIKTKIHFCAMMGSHS